MGADYKVNKDLSIKAKVDQKAKVTSSFKYQVDERINLVASAQLNFS